MSDKNQTPKESEQKASENVLEKSSEYKHISYKPIENPNYKQKQLQRLEQYRLQAQEARRVIVILTEMMAEHGDACDQFELAVMYILGKNVEKDCEKAVELLEKAAANEIKMQEKELEEIKSREPDLDKALDLLESATAIGHENAKKLLQSIREKTEGK